MPIARTILVADDCPDDFMLLQHAFRRAGFLHALYHLHDGAQVLAHLKGESPFSNRELWPFPDLLILDSRMHAPDGFEVLSFLQAHSPLKTPLVLMMSGSDSPQDAARALELGAASYYVKPQTSNERTMQAV